MIQIWKYEIRSNEKSLEDTKRTIRNSTFYGAETIRLIFDEKRSEKLDLNYYITLFEYAKELGLKIEIRSNLDFFSYNHLRLISRIRKFDLILLNYIHQNYFSTKLQTRKKSTQILSFETLRYIGILLIIIALINAMVLLYQDYAYSLFADSLNKSQPVIQAEEQTKLSQQELFNYQNKQNSLLQMSPDYIGWIEIPDTPISFPFVQTNDNQYYLDHDYLQDESIYGSIYLDYRVNSIDDNYLVLYGHSVHNKQMFGFLSQFKEQNYFNEHQTVKLYFPNEIRSYQIFSVQLIDANTTSLSLPISSLDNTISHLQDSNLIKANVDTKDTTQIITLITCEYSQDNGRIFVNAVLTNIQMVQ